MVGGALTHCALLHSMFELKAAQMNVQRSLIRERMIHKLQLEFNVTEAPKTFVAWKVKLQLITVQ